MSMRVQNILVKSGKQISLIKIDNVGLYFTLSLIRSYPYFLFSYALFKFVLILILSFSQINDYTYL